MKKWTIYSEILKQKVYIEEISPGTMLATAEDGTKYLPSELAMFTGRKVPPQVHIIKKVFKGQIIDGG